MNARLIAVLCLILVVLGAVYFVDYRRKLAREEAELAETQLAPFPISGITSLRIVNSFGEFALEKQQNTWWIVEPIRDKADQHLIVSKMLSELEKATKSNPFTIHSRNALRMNWEGSSSGPDGSSYGLEQPQMRVTMQSGETGKSVSLLFGKETPIPGEVYLVDASHPQRVYTTMKKVSDALLVDLTDLRDKTVLAVDPDRVERMSIRRGGESISATRRPDGEWDAVLQNTSGTLRTLADSVAMETLFLQIQAARAESFATTATLSPSLFGLDHPVAVLDLQQRSEITTGTVAEKKSSPQVKSSTLLIGDRATTANRETPLHFAMQRGRNAVFTVHHDLVSALMRPFSAFKDHRLITLSPDEIHYLQIEAITSAFALSRTEGGRWTLATDPQVRIDQDKVRRYIDYCLGLRSEVSRQLPPMSPATARLENPALRVFMATGDRKQKQGFELGGAVKGEPYFFARRSPAPVDPEESGIFLVGLPLSGFFDLMKTADYFVYRRLLDFDANEVERVVITSISKEDAGQSAQLELKRSKEVGVWTARLNTGATVEIPANLAESFLIALQRIDYAEVAQEPTPEQLREEQLDAPPSRIEMFGSKDHRLCEIAFGDLRRAASILVRSGKDDYYQVNSDSFSALNTALHDIMVRMGS